MSRPVGVEGVDVAAAGVALAVGVVNALLRHSSGTGWAPLWLELSAQVVGSVAVLFSRSHPLPVLALCFALSAVSPLFAALIAVYNVGRWLASIRVASTAFALALLASLPLWWASSRPNVGVLWAFSVVIALAFAVGMSRREVQAARETAVRLARDGERADLAREMHDVVAHHVSYVVVGANILARELTDPDQRAQVEQIRDSGSAALSEMRAVLAQLSDGAASPLNEDGLARIPALVAEARTAGQPVEADVRMEPSEPPSLVERTVVRLVSEGLTNAVRHAPGARTTVRVEASPERVVVEVHNDATHRADTGITTGGHGLDALGERVRMLGGTLSAGPDARGGYMLRAVLPGREGAR